MNCLQIKLTIKHAMSIQTLKVKRFFIAIFKFIFCQIDVEVIDNEPNRISQKLFDRIQRANKSMG